MIKKYTTFMLQDIEKIKLQTIFVCFGATSRGAGEGLATPGLNHRLQHTKHIL